MCQLGNLDMTQCSETIETVSLSSSVKVQENKTQSRTVVSKYRFRDTKLYGKLSLMEYYEQVRHKMIPGKTTNHTFPILSEEAASHNILSQKDMLDLYCLFINRGMTKTG